MFGHKENSHSKVRNYFVNIVQLTNIMMINKKRFRTVENQKLR